MSEETSSALPPESEIELFPDDYFAPLELDRIFPRPGPLEIDIGCGDGGFIAARAEQLRERNFLGLEKLGGRVLRAAKKASRLGLTNVRLLRIESAYAVQYLFPAASVEMAHLLFPDPWPKKKHRRRRIVTPEFLVSIHRILVPNGRFRIATDEEHYFKSISELIPDSPFTEVAPPEGETFPVTTFEKHFVREGAPIYRLELRKLS
jgi:tRNA (guanine-N7-)-methyltransferase